jgi:hypothetical protein
MAPLSSVVLQTQLPLQPNSSTKHLFTYTAIENLMMKLTAVLAASTSALASARPQYGAATPDPHAWMPASTNDCKCTHPKDHAMVQS